MTGLQILLELKGIKVVPADFQYISNKNSEWMTTETLAQWIQDNFNTLK